jgi:hypothetical protein
MTFTLLWLQDNVTDLSLSTFRGLLNYFQNLSPPRGSPDEIISSLGGIITRVRAVRTLVEHGVRIGDISPETLTFPDRAIERLRQLQLLLAGANTIVRLYVTARLIT